MKSPESSPTRDRMMLLVAAALFSTGGAAVKATTLNGWQVACFRSAVAALALVALVPAARSRWTWRTWLVGTAYAATMILFVLSNKLTTAANAIFLQGTAPLYVLLLGPWLLDEKIRLRQLGFIATLGVGMAFFFVGSQPATRTAMDPMLGNVLGTCTGLTWALCIMGLRWLGRDAADVGATSAAVCCGNIIASAATVAVAFPVGASALLDWAVVVYLGVFQIAIAYVFLVRGVARVPAIEASLILLAEPVLSPFWAWLAHGEVPTPWAMIGGVIILGATMAMALSSHRNP